MSLLQDEICSVVVHEPAPRALHAAEDAPLSHDAVALNLLSACTEGTFSGDRPPASLALDTAGTSAPHSFTWYDLATTPSAIQRHKGLVHSEAVCRAVYEGKLARCACGLHASFISTNSTSTSA